MGMRIVENPPPDWLGRTKVFDSIEEWQKDLEENGSPAMGVPHGPLELIPYRELGRKECPENK
jgi:hypothetical protein